MNARLVGVCLLLTATTAIADDNDTKTRVVFDEVIVLEGTAPPSTPPKVTNFIKTKTPPYSDEAILSDAWTKAWMLLEIDERGVVTRAKFLKRPGYELEQIAMSEAFKLRFKPARDAAGRAMRSTMLWEIEWPSAWWLSTINGTRSAAIKIVGFPPRRQDWYVPCRGSGPMNLGSVRPAYKDCSKPDLAKIDTEAWVDRPR
jgi:hypothetical protein